MRTFSLTSAALAAGLTINAAQAEEFNIPVFPSPDEVAQMSADDVQLAASKMLCSATYGPFDTQEQYDAFSDNQAAFESAVGERIADREMAEFSQAIEVRARNTELFGNDPILQDMRLSAESLAGVAMAFQLSFSMDYPHATCGPDYAFGPFESAKRMDLDAFWDMIENMPAEEKQAIEQAFAFMTGNEDVSLEDMVRNIDPAKVAALQNYAIDAEADGKITAEETIGIIPLQAALSGDRPQDYEIASVNRVAGDILRAVDVPASADNVYALSYQIIKAGYALQEMEAYMQEFEGPTSDDAFDAMEDSTLGVPSVPAPDIIGPTRENLRGFTVPEPGLD